MKSSYCSSEFPNGTPKKKFTDSTSNKTWATESRPVPSDQKHGKKREHSPDKEWSKRKSHTRRNPDNSREDGGKAKDTPKEESKFQTRPTQQLSISIHAPSTSTYPTNGYTVSDYYAVDPNHNNIMPQYDMCKTMNHWGSSVTSSMPPTDMTSASTGMNPFPYVVPADPSMNGMIGPMAGYCPVPMMNGAMPQKVTMTFPNCTLVPPPPDAPVPTRRNRPNGCKTVFVGGLPQMITEEIIKEAFSGYGEISTVRMNPKNFCHIRFANEHIVDQAMFFSGYCLKIANKDETAYSSCIHVDYAIARDDEREYECTMHTLSREMRHKNGGLDPQSPSPIDEYSEGEAAILGESLHNEDSFKQACEVLITWLDRGECNKRNAGKFYSMIEITYNHVRRLVAKKTKIKDELAAVKQKLHQQSIANASQFMDIESVFNHASAQKAWDHFTKAQRKYINQWKRRIADIKLQNLEDLLEERVEDEMEISDSEDQKPPEESTDKNLELNKELVKVQEDKQKLQEEVELLHNQLQATNNKIISLKGEKLELNEELSKVQEDKQKLQEEMEFLRNQLQATNNEMVSLKEENNKKIATLSSATLS